MVVMKFGGTSTQDAKAQLNVAAIVKERLDQSPVVVISAIAKATNFLERTGKLAEQGEVEQAHSALKELFDRHFAILDTNVKDKNRHSLIANTLSQSLAELHDLIKGVSIIRELTPRILDTFYSYGELLSSRLIAATMQEQGIDAVWVDTKDFMLTDKNFNRALPDMEVVEKNVQNIIVPLVRQGKVVVTQGFIGVTKDGFRTTMGRESSDYSGAVLGAALNAENIQIWTDVDGILTADPRVVGNPKKVRAMAPEEAFELSYFGAKVLHPNTMLPALEKNIPVYIYNSLRPNLSGTRVARDCKSTGIVKSVSYKQNVVIVTVTPLKRQGQYIFWDHIYNILTKYDVSTNLTSTSEYSISIILETKYRVDAVVHDLSMIGSVDVQEGKGIISLVGLHCMDIPENMGRLFNTLSGIPISMISFGASRSNICIVLDNNTVLDAVCSLHKEFFDQENNNDIFEILDHYKK